MKQFKPRCCDIPSVVEALNTNRIIISYLADLCRTKVDKSKDSVEKFLDKQFEKEIIKRIEITKELVWWLNIKQLR
jgi:hypothetical protein